jgi:hypothetical protein
LGLLVRRSLGEGGKRPRLILLIFAVVLVTMAVVLAVSGGFRTTVGGFRISARSPLATSIAAVIAGAWWWYLARRERSIAADLENAWLALERHSTRLIGVIALVAAIVAASFATRSAAGADASGYLSQARLWSDGAWIVSNPLADILNQRDPWLTTPLGWRPAGSSYQVPTYPPGLPLLMAIPHAVAGLNGANAVVIVSAAVAVWATGMLAGGVAGIVAAILIAFSPVFLHQAFQPMSDVPVTAAWMLCFLMLARGGTPVWAGIACAAAILIRPNLAPLAIVPFFVAKSRMAFAFPVAAAGGFLAVMQWLWYGSPLQSGYGSLAELFSVANVIPNTSRYFNWLIATAPVLLLAPFGFARLRQQPLPRALATFAVLVIVSYLAYGVFDHWSYLRFLLPALAVFAVFAAVELAGWMSRWPVSWRAPMLVGLSLAVMAHGLFVARSLDTFRLADQLRRVEQVAAAISHTAPANAVIVAGEQSGSMRYYTRRSILRWDAATADTLPKALETLLNAERPIYIVLDAWEIELFREKFPNVGPAALDWPPMLEAGSSHRTLAWNLADRFRFQIGQRINTIRIP